jgi:putative transposase
MNSAPVARLLAFVTGLVNPELLLKNESLRTENRILKAHLRSGFRLSDKEPTTLAAIGKRLGRKLRREAARIASPDQLGWYRQLVAGKFDGSRQHRTNGRPPVNAEIENLVARLARESAGWGYDRIEGALAGRWRHTPQRTEDGPRLGN